MFNAVALDLMVRLNLSIINDLLLHLRKKKLPKTFQLVIQSVTFFDGEFTWPKLRGVLWSKNKGESRGRFWRNHLAVGKCPSNVNSPNNSSQITIIFHQPRFTWKSRGFPGEKTRVFGRYNLTRTEKNLFIQPTDSQSFMQVAKRETSPNAPNPMPHIIYLPEISRQHSR